MNKKFVALSLASLISLSLLAQNDNPGNRSSKKFEPYPRNSVQVNIPGIVLFKNYGFSYERSIARKISLVAGYRTMPQTKLSDVGLGKKLSDQFSTDANGMNDLEKTQASNNAYTLECRFYSGKHSGLRGFYVGVYGRYATFDLKYPYEYNGTNKDYTIPFDANVKGIGGGVEFGAQWIIAKTVSLNWYILGAHLGSLTGSANGPADLSDMSTEDQQNLQQDINDFIIYGSGDKSYLDATVTNQGVTANVKGPFVGIRGGITIGIAF